jgi:hypothetical protein
MGKLIVMVWKYRKDIYILSDIYHSPKNGSYCDEHGLVLKPASAVDRQKNDFVDKSDRMITSYLMS